MSFPLPPYLNTLPQRGRRGFPACGQVSPFSPSLRRRNTSALVFRQRASFSASALGPQRRSECHVVSPRLIKGGFDQVPGDAIPHLISEGERRFEMRDQIIALARSGPSWFDHPNRPQFNRVILECSEHGANFP
jgi:hypothetical protein